MVKSLGTLAAASLTANQLASLARNSKYLYNMARGRRSYGKKRTTVSGGGNSGYITGPRYRRVAPVITRPQLKFATNDNVGATFGIVNPQDSLLTSIAAGDNPFNRDGRYIRLMNIRGQMVFPTGADTRVIIYIPRDPNDSINLTLPGDAYDPAKFRVLYDNYWHPSSGGGNRDLSFNINFGKYGHKIEYDGPLGTNLVRGGIRLYQQRSISSDVSSGNFIFSFVDN